MHTYYQLSRTYKRPQNAMPDMAKYAAMLPVLAQTGSHEFVLRVPSGRRPMAVERQLRLFDASATWDVVAITEEEDCLVIRSGDAVAP